MVYESLTGFLGLVGLFIMIFFLLGLYEVFTGGKTGRYREKLVNMYVSGMVRKFAKEDGVDIKEEYNVFLKEEKKESLSMKRLSKVIEDELSEKIVAEQEKKLNKK